MYPFMATASFIYYFQRACQAIPGDANI
jgi:hypothetical protein